MSGQELALFSAFIRKCRSYVEFGAGGSTVLASSCVASILSVDSSKEWLHRVEQACASSKTKPELIFVDLGPTGEWGFPVDPSTRGRWPSYHSDIWSIHDSRDADLYLIDGRFRVACFAQVVLRCRPNAIIGIHDFASRPAYHCVNEIAQEIARAGDMSFFLPLQKKEIAEAILQRVHNDPS
jgi:hypothetical protein